MRPNQDLGTRIDIPIIKPNPLDPLDLAPRYIQQETRDRLDFDFGLLGVSLLKHRLQVSQIQKRQFIDVDAPSVDQTPFGRLGLANPTDKDRHRAIEILLAHLQGPSQISKILRPSLHLPLPLERFEQLRKWLDIVKHRRVLQLHQPLHKQTQQIDVPRVGLVCTPKRSDCLLKNFGLDGTHRFSGIVVLRRQKRVAGKLLDKPLELLEQIGLLFIGDDRIGRREHRDPSGIPQDTQLACDRILRSLTHVLGDRTRALLEQSRQTTSDPLDIVGRVLRQVDVVFDVR